MTTRTSNRAFPFASMALLASAATLSFLAVPAKAASEPVSFARSELASRSGRNSVEQRLEAAAGRVCAAGGIDRMNLTDKKEYRACVSAALAHARADLASVQSTTQMAAR